MCEACSACEMVANVKVDVSRGASTSYQRYQAANIKTICTALHMNNKSERSYDRGSPNIFWKSRTLLDSPLLRNFPQAIPPLTKVLSEMHLGFLPTSEPSSADNLMSYAAPSIMRSNAAFRSGFELAALQQPQQLGGISQRCAALRRGSAAWPSSAFRAHPRNRRRPALGCWRPAR
jgi:hypothetical protein